MEFDGGLQFFKEESSNGAIFNIYLKKVCYDTSFREEGDEKARLQWKLEEHRVLKYGTLERLVECLCSTTGELDTIFSDVLFVTYRSFTTTYALALAILKRHDDILMEENIQLQKDACRRSLKTALTFWIDHYSEDFEGEASRDVLQLLDEFTSINYPDSELAVRIKEKIKEVCEPGQQESSANTCMHLIEACWKLNSGTLKVPIDLLCVEPRYFAEQLTYLDSELFKRVTPYHCLGSIWSRRNEKKSSIIQPTTVYATVEQFNAVSCRVIATILKWPLLMNEPSRVAILTKWIDIAQECRQLKNFSSLKAIVAALQANPIYRLKKLWTSIAKEKIDLYKELANIFSEENNQNLWRGLLDKEGTAKFVEVDTSSVQKNSSKRPLYIQNKKLPFNTNSIQQYPTIQGTVPYLGTFLTDLVMLDTALKDTTANGLINFEKKRKEFEMLARIRLLQSTAAYYKIVPDAVFYDWFYSIRTYNDNESHELSLEIEPSEEVLPNIDRKGHKKNPSLGFFTMRRRLSMDDMLFIGDEAVELPWRPKELDNLATWRIKNNQARRPISQQFKHSNTAISLQSFSSSLTSPTNKPTSVLSPSESLSLSVGRRVLQEARENRSSENTSGESSVLPIRVFFRCHDVDASNNYKTIALRNTDHSINVIRNVLLKFNVKGKPEDFTLSQILSNSKEMELPERGNIFYAIVRPSQEQVIHLAVHRRTAVTGPRIKGKPPKSPKKNNKLFRIFTSMSALS